MTNNQKNKPNNISITVEQRECLNRAEKALASRNYSQAESDFRKLASQNIPTPIVYSQLAYICAMSNRLDEAQQLWLYTLKNSPGFIGALVGLGDICKFKRDFRQAIDYYQKVVIENPKFALVFLNLSISLTEIGKLDEGEKSCREAINLNPNLLQAKEYLGLILVRKGNLTQAKKLFTQLITDNPVNVKALYELGNILKSQGELKQAALYYQKAYTIQPGYTQAHFTYSSIHKYKDSDEPHIVLMQKQHQLENLPTVNKIQLSFALAKSFEDVKDFKQAFKYLEQGNFLRFNQYHYTSESDVDFIKNIMETFSEEAVNNCKFTSQYSEQPIFIVGMPRSGTTLVEQILSSHSKVHGAGELDYFFKLGTDQFLTQETDFLFAPLNTYTKKQLENIGATYLKKTKELNKGATYITDKLPFNMLLIGLIKMTLPNAKIIHCVRDPKDNCLSIFKQNFTTDNYRFGYDLKSLGKFHNTYRDMMKHWHSLFPEAIYDVHYETLVNDPETEIKKLVAACGLAWENECLHFNKSTSTVNTASAVQVRKPMYTSSVGIWQQYREYLQPLFDELDEVL